MKNIHKFVFSSILLSDAFSFNLLLSHINKQVWRAFHNPNLFSFLLNFLCVFFLWIRGSVSSFSRGNARLLFTNHRTFQRVS